MFQKAVEKNLQLPVSVFISDRSVPFARAISDFLPIREKMLGMAEDEIRLGDLRQRDGYGANGLSEGIQRELARRVEQLEHLFEGMDRDGILAVIEQAQRDVSGVQSMHDPSVLEVYYTINTKLLRYVKKIGPGEDAALQSKIAELYNISRYGSWEEAFRALRGTLEQVFARVDRSIENKNEDVINKVKSYVLDHLDGDTSLYALSDHVHLCPGHLLRMFKKQEGITILQYINDLKLAKARQMLTETDMQIKEIATKLGFTSAGYFGRFFKSKTGVTPNFYRDQK